VRQSYIAFGVLAVAGVAVAAAMAFLSEPAAPEPPKLQVGAIGKPPPKPAIKNPPNGPENAQPDKGDPEKSGLRGLGPVRPGPLTPGDETLVIAKSEKVASDRVKIRVVDPAGQALYGAEIKAISQRRALGKKFSDEQGEALFEGIQEGEFFQADVWHPRFAEGRRVGPCEPGTVITLTFPRDNSSSLEIRILDDVDRALPAATINLLDSVGHSWTLPEKLFPLDANGRGTIALSPGRYSIAASAPGHSESERLFITINPDSKQSMLLRPWRNASLRAQVIGPFDPASTAVLEGVFDRAGGKATFTRSLTREAPISRDGELSLADWPPGRYQVRLSVKESPRLASAWQALEFQPGIEASATFELAERPLSLEGIVEDADGQRLAGVEVSCQTQSVKTDSDGRFEFFGLPTGFQNVTVKAEGYARESFEIVIDARLSQRKLLRLSAVAEVHGRILSPSGAPLSRHRVTLVSLATDREGEMTTAETDAEGWYHFSDVQPGPYFIATGAEDIEATGKPQITVQPGQKARIQDLTREP
jgi:hypothetical protein